MNGAWCVADPDVQKKELHFFRAERKGKIDDRKSYNLILTSECGKRCDRRTKLSSLPPQMFTPECCPKCAAVAGFPE